MTAFPSYKIGTVQVSAGATVVVGSVDAIWAGGNARAGDDIVIAGHTVIVEDVIDTQHLAIDPWPYADVPAGTAYKILQRSPLRFAGGQTAADVIALVAALKVNGLYVFVPPDLTEPDPSLGEDNQYGFQATTGKLWQKLGGLWSFVGIYKDWSQPKPWDAETTWKPFDVAEDDGSSYFCIAENTNQRPPNATYWQLIAAKGGKGDKGDTGSTGAGYKAASATSLTIGAGPQTFATQTGLAYTVGARARASSNANSTNYMEGLVTAYNPVTGSLTINVTRVGGSGSTAADWNINLAGDPGAGNGDMVSTNNLADVSSKIAAIDNLSTKGDDIAAAATLNPNTATGNFLRVTGSTAITAITLSSGRQRTVYFTGAPLLTNGASLVLPGGGNIQAAPGDIAVFVADGTVVRCSDYLPAAQANARALIGAAASPSFRTRTIITSGSGTYTTPAGCKAIEVTLIGAGGGGGAGGTAASGSTNGAGGGATTFGSSFMSAGGGNPGGAYGAAAGDGGTASGGDTNHKGSTAFATWGAGGGSNVIQGTAGAPGPFGGNGYGGWPGANGQNAPANSGGGGGGGGGPSLTNGGGGGGGAGALCRKLIINPAPSYSYAIGSGGAGGIGAGGASNGAMGGSGLAIIDEYY
jgi:hypothetical protein